MKDTINDTKIELIILDYYSDDALQSTVADSVNNSEQNNSIDHLDKSESPTVITSIVNGLPLAWLEKHYMVLKLNTKIEKFDIK